jgi:oligo-alginate lyase
MNPRCRCLFALGCALLSLPLSARASDAPAQAFAELKVYSTAGMPWRAATEDWAGAKLRVDRDPQWDAWLRQERRSVDDWMEKSHDRVTWACGWYHDFVSPKDASRLTWTPAIPGEDVAFLTSPSDSHVEITPKIMGGWVFEFRSRHADMIQRAARLYRVTGNEKYAEWAAGQLDFYAQHYLEWQPQRKDQGARLYWQTLDEATNGTKYIDTVRLLDGWITPARKQLWWEMFFKPESEVLDGGYQSIHNIATWHRCAMAEFALVYHDAALWREAIDGKFGLRNQIAKGITADYLWWEQSLHYNEYVVEALLTLFTQAGLAGRSNELAPEMVVAENLMLAPIYLRFPTGMLPNPADGTGIEFVPHRAFLASTYRVFPTTIGLAEAANTRDWNTLLDPPPASPRPDTLPLVTSRNLEASRMAVLRRGAWQVFLHYGQLTASHSQSEALNFSAFYGDTDITHDPGTVGYGSPYHKDYYTKGLNHNVPLINGEGEIPPQAGKLLEFSDEKARVSAAQPKYRPGTTAERTLVIDGDRLVDTATIRNTGAASSLLGLALHLQGKVRLPKEFTPAADFAKDRPASFSYWREVTSAKYTDHATFDVDYGARTMRVTLAVPGEFTLWHGSTPDVPPARREGFYLETHGTEAVFTTTFEPVPKK